MSVYDAWARRGSEHLSLPEADPESAAGWLRWQNVVMLGTAPRVPGLLFSLLVMGRVTSLTGGLRASPGD